METARQSVELEGMLKRIKDEQDAMDRKITLIMEFVGEGQRRAAMRRAGIDVGIDLRAYTASLRDDIKGAFRISAAIRPVMDILRDADAAIDNDTEPDIIDTIIGGIDI